MNYERGPRPLFNEKPFSEEINNIKDRITSDINGTGQNSYRDFSKTEERTRLIEENKMHIPQNIVGKARVVEDEVRYSISFDGANGGFFRYWPSGKASNDRPVGEAYGDCVVLPITKTNDVQSMKAMIQKVHGDFMTWLEPLKKEAEEYNNNLPQFVEQVWADREKKLAANKDLEDSLNS